MSRVRIASVAHLVNYCLEYEWAASAKDRTRSGQAELAIEHAVVTGHDIDGEYRESEEPATGWVLEWSPIE
jgi:hypothetical protein